MDDDADFTAVTVSDEQRWQATVRLWEAVLQAREHGCTWAEIGEWLGVTRQAAQERFGRRQPERSGGRQPAKPVQDEALW